MTAIDITMLDTAVLHPALKFTADRENGPASRSKSSRKLIGNDYRSWEMKCFQHTSGEVARSAGADDVHGPDGDHLLVAIDVVVLEHREAPPNCYPFLK